MKRSRSRRK